MYLKNEALNECELTMKRGIMKKKLFLLSILSCACSGVAYADSSVQLYGVLDVGYGITHGGWAEPDKNFQMIGNGSRTSNWGIKGTEDLGNGMQAFFKLESRIEPESGASSSRAFNRAAYVGLQGNWGAVQVGRQYNVLCLTIRQFTATVTNNSASSLGSVGLSADQLGGGVQYRNYGIGANRFNSLLMYTSPNIYGLTVRAGVTLKNDEVLGATDEKNIYAIGAIYNYNKLTLGAAFESKPFDRGGIPAFNSGTSFQDDVSASWGIAGKYDFGFASFYAGYGDMHLDSAGKGYWIGARIPLQRGWIVGAQFAQNIKAYAEAGKTNALASGEKIKPIAVEAYVYYSFSKRTNWYFNAAWINNDTRILQARGMSGKTMHDIKRYSFVTGIAHTF